MCVYIIYTYMRYANPGAMATEVAFAVQDNWLQKIKPGSIA